MKRSTSNNTLKTIMFNSIVVLVAMVISLFIFYPQAIKNEAESRDLLSIYENTDYDYIIKNPSKEQIESFSATSSINKVVPYYQTVYVFKIQGNEYEITIKSIDKSEDLRYTEFSNRRLLKSEDFTGNCIYLDYGFAKTCNLKLGDKIGTGVMEFTIAGFYQNYDDYLAYTPDLKSILVDNLLYAGVYVKVADVDSFKTDVVADYKPLATLKTRESFSDDAAYERYLSEFEAKDYSSYIVEKDEDMAEAEESYKIKTATVQKDFLFAGIIAGVIIFVGTITIALLNKKNTKYEVADGGRKKVVGRYTASGIAGVIMSVIIWCIGVLIVTQKQSHYITVANILSSGYLSVVIPVIACVLGAVINFIIVRGYKEQSRARKK